MAHFLAPVLRTQFTLFFRHGYSYIPKSALLQFDGEISSGIQQQLANHFEQLSPFEYEQEYIILHLVKEDNENLIGNIWFEIENLQAIYPLTEAARISVLDRVDSRIRIESPLFSETYRLVEQYLIEEEKERGIKALWTICGLGNELADYETIKPQITSGLNYRHHGVKAADINESEFLPYLLAYERYSFFPKSTVGYFYDACEIFSYHQGKKDGIEGTKLKTLLDDIKAQKPGADVRYVAEQLQENAPEKFKEQMAGAPLQWMLVVVFFLKWKEELRDEAKSLETTSLFHKGKVAFIGSYEQEVKTALVLLGAFFGFKRFYNDYYNALVLPFFNGSSQHTSLKQIYNNEDDQICDKLSDKPVAPIVVEARQKESEEESVLVTESAQNDDITVVLQDQEEYLQMQIGEPTLFDIPVPKNKGVIGLPTNFLRVKEAIVEALRDANEGLTQAELSDKMYQLGLLKKKKEGVKEEIVALINEGVVERKNKRLKLKFISDEEIGNAPLEVCQEENKE